MVSSEEIRIGLASKREDANIDQRLREALEIQRHLEWVDDACVIDFDSTPIKNMSITIKHLFEERGYHLEEGTPINGIYGMGHASLRLLVGYFAFRYRFKVEIYSKGENTFLKIYKVMGGIRDGIIDGWQGLALYNKEFNAIIATLKYLHPSYEGYLVCDKCHEYYKLQLGESPEDFTDKCECGGRLKYFRNIDGLI